MRFHSEISKIISELSSIPHLTWSSDSMNLFVSGTTCNTCLLDTDSLLNRGGH